MNILNRSKEVNLWRGCLGSIDKRNFLQFIKSSTSYPVDSLVRYYLEFSSDRCKSKGRLNTVVFLKDLYGLALRYAASVSFEPLPYVRTSKDGLPRVLSRFRPYLKGSPDAKRAALSVLQLYKLIETPEAPHSLQSIVEPYSGSTSPHWLDTFKVIVSEEFPPEKQAENVSKLRGRLHISGKNGPNGPAMTTLQVDRKALEDSDLYRNIERLAALTGNDQLIQIMQSTSCTLSETFRHPKRTPAHSRLRVKHESGGKARIFAILDNFSQSALKPIHEFLMKWLKSNSKDGTNDHAYAARAVCEWTKTPSPIWSFDLTTATDRYPVFLQEIVIESIFGSEICTLWKAIITDRQFIAPNGVDKVSFAVGQPLGALSSWCAFAVTHHLHVRTAARLAGRDTSDYDYRIIGDDVGLYKDAAVAREYIGMMNDLRVPISTPKSITPDQCKGVNAAELAKRVFVDGNELTPVPPDAVIVYMRDPFGRRILIETGIDRGYMRLNSPYTVQSLMSRDNEWAALTFPLGRTLALITGVKVVLSWWTDPTESPPGGLNPGWAYWENGYYPIPEYGFKWILKSYLNKEVNSAIASGNRIREELYNSTWDGSLERNQGGGWQPGITDAGQTLSLVITYMSQSYGEALYELADMVEFETLDLYRLLAKLHSFLKPEDLFRKQNFMDEKARTRVHASALVKLASKIRREGLDTFLSYTNS